MCYLNFTGADGPGLPADTTPNGGLHGGGVDLGISAWVLPTDQSQNETVFFFGNYCPGNDAGDPFGEMPSNWQADTPENGISYNAFSLQQTLPGGDSAYFASILDAADPSRTVLVCDVDKACWGPDTYESPMWVPTGSYYDTAHNTVWLWFGQYTSGLLNDPIQYPTSPCRNTTMRSSLIAVTPADGDTNFTNMQPMNNNCDVSVNNPTPFFATRYFIQVAPVPIHTESNSQQDNPLQLPCHEYPEDGALIFGTSCENNTYNCPYRDSSVYLGYFVPPNSFVPEGDTYYAQYHVYYLSGLGLDGKSPWTPFDPKDVSPDPAPLPIINRCLPGGDDNDAGCGNLQSFGEISFQKISNHAGENILVMSAANNYGEFELRIAEIKWTDPNGLTLLAAGLNNLGVTAITNTSWGYGNYLVPASMSLVVNENNSGECHLYYDRVVSTWGGVVCGNELYGTAVIKSVANIPAGRLGLADCN
jgi:hypothetical protein